MKISNASENGKPAVAESETKSEAPAKKLRLSKIGKKNSSTSVQGMKRTKKIIVSSDEDPSERKSTEEVGGLVAVMFSDRRKLCGENGS